MLNIMSLKKSRAAAPADGTKKKVIAAQIRVQKGTTFFILFIS